MPAVLAPPAATPASAASPAGGVIFTRRPPAAGDRYEEEWSMQMHLAMTMDRGQGQPQKTDLETEEAETRDEQILAVSGDAVTKVQVTYTARTEAMKEGGKESKTPSPLAGRTYLVVWEPGGLGPTGSSAGGHGNPSRGPMSVEARDGKTSVLTSPGRPAPIAQARQVQSSYANLGQPDPILAGMPRRPLVPGQKVPELERALRAELAGRAKDMPVSAAAVTFTGVAGRDGLFDVALELSKEEPPMKYAIALKGQLRVSTATSQLTGFTLEGPLTIGTAAGEQKTKVTGQGTLTLTSRRRPR
jgi:hypothetical protein